MATPYPNLDRFDPAIQQIREEAESLAYGGDGAVATDGEISSLFVQGFDRPRVSALMNDVIVRSDQWRLGKTMVAIADRLGTDHSAISRALHWGELSPKLEGFLTACKTKPVDLDRKIELVLNARHRSALMAVADYLARRMQYGVWPKGGHLVELHAELLFELLEKRPVWIEARRNRDLQMATRIISMVCDDPTREIVPFWYTRDQRRIICRLVHRLREDARFAFRYLSLVLSRWEKSIVLAWSATDGDGWV
jgi:hypothetical protein